MRKSSIFSVLLFFVLLNKLQANPVDPVGGAVGIFSYIIYAMCIVIEISLLWFFTAIFDKFDGDKVIVFLCIMLNLATLFLILQPFLNYTKSVALAELSVVVMEAYGIFFIFKKAVRPITLKRSFYYASCLNIVTYIIGVITLGF